jgi:hypothetical protein
MRLQDVARREPWMTGEECLLMKKFIAAIRRLLAAHGVSESPLLTLRTADVGISWLLVRRLEAGLKPLEESAAPPELSGSLADHIGKGRERLRKAIRELEDACARMGRPIDIGLADEMLPMVRKTRDLLHDKGMERKEDEC